MNLQSRIDARGVSYANGLRVTRTFLEALTRTPSARLAGKP
jgi:hypothetical protein